jgi:hypothetical protein
MSSQDGPQAKRAKLIQQLEKEAKDQAPVVHGLVVSCSETPYLLKEGNEVRYVTNVIIKDHGRLYHVYGFKVSFPKAPSDYRALTELRPGQKVEFPRIMLQGHEVQLSFNLSKFTIVPGEESPPDIIDIPKTDLSFLNHLSQKRAGVFLTEKLAILAVNLPDGPHIQLQCRVCRHPLLPGPCQRCHVREPLLGIKLKFTFSDDFGRNLYLTLSEREVDTICEPLERDSVELLSDKTLGEFRAAISDTSVQFILHRKVEGGNLFMEKLFVFPPDKKFMEKAPPLKLPFMEKAPPLELPPSLAMSKSLIQAMKKK